MTALDVRDDLRELAEHYETVTSLDLTPEPGGLRAIAGPRLPPGMQQILDHDEVQQALTAVDGWAGFCAGILAGERQADTPSSTPARLRHVGEYAEHFLNHDDELLALAFQDDLAEHLTALRRLSKRGLRRVRTGMACQDPTCTGQYISALPRPGDNRHHDTIECDKCHNQVPHTVWSSWPRARIEWITIEHAARLAGTTTNAIKIRASRNNWRKQGAGRDVKYHIEDVRDTPTKSVAQECPAV